MKVSIPNLLEQWYELVENAKKTLSLAGDYYDYYVQLQFLTRDWKECFPDENVSKAISVAPLVSNVWKIFWELWKSAAVGKLMTQFQQQRSGALIKLGAQPRRNDQVVISHIILALSEC